MNAGPRSLPLPGRRLPPRFTPRARPDMFCGATERTGYRFTGPGAFAAQREPSVASRGSGVRAWKER